MSENLSWTRKYMPKSSSEMVGQQTPVSRLKTFIENYKTSRKKAVILYGFTGSGKTSSVYAVANDLNYEVLEVNASDFRNASSINDILGPALLQMSLFLKGKIILMDEIDGVSGRKDRGGIPALSKLIAKSSFPIIMTANDPWNKKFSSLRRSSEMLEFSPLNSENVYNVLKNISQKESIDTDLSALKSMANRCGGDLRAAINDLQIISGGTKILRQEDVDSISDRNRTDSIMQALVKILKTTDFNLAAGAFDDIDEQPNDWFLWVDENMPLEYTNPKYLAKAYESLSSADIFNRRIRRNQYWRLLVYVKFLLTAGVASAKDEKIPGTISYKRSSRPLKIWMANARYNKRKNIAAKIAEHTHSSTAKVVQNIDYFKTIIKGNNKIAEELNLDQEEVEWLKK